MALGIDLVKMTDRSSPTSARRTPDCCWEAVITLTAKLGLFQIAEGIEDETTREQLVELGCRCGRAYLFAEPMPLSQAPQWSTQDGD